MDRTLRMMILVHDVIVIFMIRLLIYLYLYVSKYFAEGTVKMTVEKRFGTCMMCLGCYRQLVCAFAIRCLIMS